MDNDESGCRRCVDESRTRLDAKVAADDRRGRVTAYGRQLPSSYSIWYRCAGAPVLVQSGLRLYIAARSGGGRWRGEGSSIRVQRLRSVTPSASEPGQTTNSLLSTTTSPGGARLCPTWLALRLLPHPPHEDRRGAPATVPLGKLACSRPAGNPRVPCRPHSSPSRSSTSSKAGVQATMQGRRGTLTVAQWNGSAVIRSGGCTAPTRRTSRATTTRQTTAAWVPAEGRLSRDGLVHNQKRTGAMVRS